MKFSNPFKLLFVLLSILTLFSCDSDSDDDMTAQEDASLDFTIDGTTYTANFDGGNAAILSVTSPSVSWTSVTMGGLATSGENITIAFIFDGKSTGQFTISGQAGDNSVADPTGLSLVIVDGTTNVNYEAVSVNVNVSSYSPIVGGVTAAVKGTFSGTVKDENGDEFSISGSFNTGSLN